MNTCHENFSMSFFRYLPFFLGKLGHLTVGETEQINTYFNKMTPSQFDEDLIREFYCYLISIIQDYDLLVPLGLISKNSCSDIPTALEENQLISMSILCSTANDCFNTMRLDGCESSELFEYIW